jgi:ADP-heptose:LPS heptosyltransferase
VLAACEIVIGVDTGLIHLAAALGRPTVTLFASTSPSLTRPAGPSAQLVEATLDCVPCRQRNCRLVPAGIVPPCHSTIGPDRVAELLARTA